MEGAMLGLFERPQEAETAKTLESLAMSIGQCKFGFSTEDELQRGVEKFLAARGLSFARERHLTRHDRPDFLLADGLAIEVKIDGSLSQLLRQAGRYAEHEDVLGILVIGTTPWLGRVPMELLGKPVRVARPQRGLA